MIIGIDHYLENSPSLNWDKEYNISTNTFKIEDQIGLTIYPTDYSLTILNKSLISK